MLSSQNSCSKSSVVEPVRVCYESRARRDLKWRSPYESGCGLTRTEKARYAGLRANRLLLVGGFETEIQMRRTVVNGRESDDSNGTSWMPQRAGFACEVPTAFTCERRIGTAARSLRAPRSSGECSSAFTSTAEKSACPQSLAGATKLSPSRFSVVAVS